MEQQVDKPEDDPAYMACQATVDRRLKIRNENLASLVAYAEKEEIVGRRISKIAQIQKFTSKLKADNRNLQALMAEMQTLNLTKYLQELATIIAETVSEKEVDQLAEMSSKIMQDYDNFSSLLIKLLKKQLDGVLASEEPRIRLKSIVHLMTELFVYGFPLPYKDMTELIKSVFNAGLLPKDQLSDLEKKEKRYYFNIEIYLMMLGGYNEVFSNKQSGRVKQWKRMGLQLRRYPQLLPVKNKEQLTKFFEQYVKEVTVVLKESLKNIKDMEAGLAEQLKLNGQFNTETEKKYKLICDRFAATRAKLFELAEILDEKIQEEELSTPILQSADITKNIMRQLDNGDIFEDEFQMRLYTQLLDIKQPEQKGEEELKEVGSTYEQIKQKFDSCSNVEDADLLTREFLKINTRKTRKSLVRDLLQYRKKYQLVTPYLCRIAANLHQKWRDVAEQLSEQLFSDYDKLKQAAANDPVVPDKKNRNLKYICELTKFGLIETDRMVGCIKDLIEHLTVGNIELLISSLESVGRFLYVNKATGPKFVFLMTQLRNVMKKKSFPTMVESQLEDCLSMFKPATKEKNRRVRTEAELKVKEIFSTICEGNVTDVAAALRPILEANYEMVLKKLLKKIVKHSYTCSYLFVVLAKRIDSKQLCQDLVRCSRKKLFAAIHEEQSQESLEWARFQGELYNYELIDKEELYDIMYEMLKVEENHVTIINSVCAILEVCKQYLLEFKRTASINQRTRFFLQFKKYINTRKYIPMFTEFELLDVLQFLQPEVLKLSNAEIDLFLSDINVVVTRLSQKQQGRKKELNELDELRQFNSSRNNNQPTKPPAPQTSSEEEDDRARRPSSRQQAINGTRSLMFDEEFEKVVSSELKNLEGRITKQKIVQSYGRKKEKKRTTTGESPNGTRTMRILGRQGDKLIARDIKLRKE